MGLRDIEVKKNYDSADYNIETEFYEKVLSVSKYYYRLTGFFSSNSFCISPLGLINFIANDGKMRIITSPRLNRNDIEILNQHKEGFIELIQKKMLEEIVLTEEIANNNLFAFGWLLSTGRLEMKIAFVKNSNGDYLYEDEIDDSSIFHIKMGIFRDEENNVLSFSGSINETYPGWRKNIESFKTFKSWEPIQKEYCNKDVEDFNAYWNNLKSGVEVVDLPDVVFEKLKSYAPTEQSKVINKLQKNKRENKEQKYIPLFFYQQQALDNWFNNNKIGLVEMATGTGKTRTAIACIERILEAEKRLVVVVACPQNSLSVQWSREIEKLGVKFEKSVMADGTNFSKYETIENKLLDLPIYDGNMIIYTTHATACSDKFIKMIEGIDKDIKVMFVGDETHKLGAIEFSKALLNRYDYRLGLSATPTRWFDEYGTNLIYKFYDKTIFEFTMREALDTINPLTSKPYLVGYKYVPMFLVLNEDEIEEYERLSIRLVKAMFQKGSEEEKNLKITQIASLRADVHKSAVNKYGKLREILKSNRDLENAITFVSPNQLDEVKSIFNEYDIPVHQFTESESTNPSKQYGGVSEREYILNNFRNNRYKSLIAITCLDEGIDIPSARIAIIMSSSTNPREYIQRIGRVIRQSEGKQNAVIYDFIIKPSYSTGNDEFDKIEKQIFDKELTRVREISQNAINAVEVIEIIDREV